MAFFKEQRSWDAEIDLEIRQGQVEVELDNGQLGLKGLKLNMKKPSLQRSEIPLTLKLEANSMVRWNDIEWSVPLEISSSDLMVQPERLTSSQIRVSLAGLNIDFLGQTQWSPLAHDWTGHVSLPDMGALAIPPQFLPPGKWSGSIEGSFQMRQAPGQQLPEVRGRLQSQNLKGAVDMKYQAGVNALGPLDIDVDLGFQFKDELSVHPLRLSADLTDLAYSYKDVFRKAGGVKNRAQFKGYLAKQSLVVESLQLQLAQWQPELSGSVPVDVSKASRLTVKLPLAKLDGLEKFLPQLASYPVKGRAKFEAQLKGPLGKSEEVAISLNPVVIRGFNAVVDYENKESGLKVSGPVSADLDASLEVVGTQPQKVDLSFNGSFDQLAIEMEDGWRKPKGEPLSIKAEARQAGAEVVLRSAVIKSPAGAIAARGTVSLADDPRLDINVSTQGIRLDDVEAMVPSLKGQGLNGQVAGQIRARGVWKTEGGIEASPLSLSGQIAGNIPQFVLAVDDPAKNKSDGDEVAEADGEQRPEPILPRWPILEKSSVSVSMVVGALRYDRLNLKGIAWNGVYDRGWVRGDLAVNSIFGGKMEASDFQVNVLNRIPEVKSAWKIQSLDATAALDWALPAYKQWASGQFSGQGKIRTPLPTVPGWAAQLVADGRIEGNQARLRTFQLIEKANEAISKIPGMGEKVALKPGDVVSEIDASWAIRDQRATFSNLVVLTKVKDEFRGKGSVGFNNSVDLEGTLYLAKAPVRGSVREANSDPDGRLIMPVEIHGHLMEPKFNFAKATVDQMLARTLEFEKKKATQKLKDRAKKEGQKLKEKVGKEAEKLFEDLLGQ